jgi:hypothetical protein
MALPDSMESSWLTLAVGTITMTAYPYRSSKDKNNASYCSDKGAIYEKHCSDKGANETYKLINQNDTSEQT